MGAILSLGQNQKPMEGELNMKKFELTFKDHGNQVLAVHSFNVEGTDDQYQLFEDEYHLGYSEVKEEIEFNYNACFRANNGDGYIDALIVTNVEPKDYLMVLNDFRNWFIGNGYTVSYV